MLYPDSKYSVLITACLLYYCEHGWVALMGLKPDP